MKKLKKETTDILDAISYMGYNVEVVGSDGLYRYISSNCDYDTLTPAQMVGKNVLKSYAGMDQESVLLDVIRTGNPECDKEMWYRSSRSGKWYRWLYSAYPVFSGAQVTDVVAVYRKMDELNSKIKGYSKTVCSEICGNDGGGLIVRGASDDEEQWSSGVMKKTLYDVRRIIQLGSLLLTGESGVGKGRLARIAHTVQEGRSGGKLIWVSCASLPQDGVESILFGTARGSYASVIDKKGLFDEAKGGSIYFEGIQFLPLSTQAKLLRALDEGTIRRVGSVSETRISCNIIASLDSDPFSAIENGVLLKELYYRLSGSTVEVPPLRERRADLEQLSGQYIHRYGGESRSSVQGLSAEVLSFFQSYDWPGNARELALAIRYACTVAEDTDYLISVDLLPPYLREIARNKSEDVFESEEYDLALEYAEVAGEALERFQKRFHERYIPDLLRSVDGNISAAAKKAKISRQYLYKLIKKYDIPI